MSEWIKVEDRLPENEGTYLVYKKRCGRVISGDYHDIGHYWANHTQDGYHWVNLHEDEIVTHWQPLPEPPNGE